MFDPTSRYAALRTLSLTTRDANGEPREIRFVERRFLPPAGASVTLVEHRVAQGDRLDNLTARYLGDPTQFWRVADANDLMRPEELTARTGRTVRIALPQA